MNIHDTQYKRMGKYLHIIDKRKFLRNISLIYWLIIEFLLENSLNN